ncbi:hypothetical protein [Halomonas sp. C05BenzN]|uniref:hypothetical protein n=1 Tax=Halomonas sp. C05BenzN TaxID=3411041 RepID=UPI003B95F9BD
MLLHLLIGQRHQAYPGQYGIEDLGAMTEYDAESNPEYLRDREAEMRGSSEFDRLAWISAEVDEDAVEARLARDDALASYRDEPGIDVAQLDAAIAAMQATRDAIDRRLGALPRMPARWKASFESHYRAVVASS